MNTISRFAAFLLSTVAGLTIVHAAPIASVVDSTIQTADPALQLAASSTLRDGSFTGGNYDAYYGTVQVVATVQGGRVVGVNAKRFPNHSGTSRSINRQALPYLQQEAVAKQSSRINIISGATLTSRAYIASLRDALKQSSN
jgi:uncharacterized protein with FMN-binding domain